MLAISTAQTEQLNNSIGAMHHPWNRWTPPKTDNFQCNDNDSTFNGDENCNVNEVNNPFDRSNSKRLENWKNSYVLNGLDMGVNDFPMLDLIPTSEGSGHRIPMDFSPYLLSSSPPASGFELLGFSSHQHSHGPSSLDPLACPHHSYTPPIQMSLNGMTNLNTRRNGPLKSIIVKTDCSSDSEGDSSAPESPHSPGRATKKVSFADHKGLALAQVRLVKEGPDEPPQLNPEVISSLTLGANAGAASKPPIKICFSQPASDYLAFRDKINSNLVSLENVILRDYTVEGTIKVKNISFEKRVFVRLSLDEWESFEDVEATYVPGPGLSYSEPYDTFSFQLEISPSFDVSKKVQFAVCFMENGTQHWDNHGGQNYIIVSENFRESQHQHSPYHPGPTFNERWLPEKRSDNWSEFSVWRDVSSDSPYY